jgi:uncharacterized membrane protein
MGGGASTPFNVGDSISWGWNAYWKNIGVLLPMVLIVAIVPIVLVLIGAVTGNRFVLAVLYLIALLLFFVLALGLHRAGIAIARGEQAEIGMLFETDLLGNYIVAAILFAIGEFVATILCLGLPILAIVWITFFGFFGFAVVDRRDSGTQALATSQKIVQAKFWPVLGLLVLIYLINIVGALLCGVGLLFTGGITLLALAHAYRTLSNEPVASA